MRITNLTVLAFTLCILSSGCDSRSAPAYNNRGIAYSEQGEFEKAIADLTKAIELDPTDAPAYKNRGDAYWQEGELDKATADYNKVIELDPVFDAEAKPLGFGQNKKSKR